MNEKEYQYSKESLLENPQTYQFTKFEGKEFLQRYVNSRKKIILKLGSSQYSDADIEKVIEQEQNDSRNKNNTTIFELRRILLHIIKNNKDTKINAKFEMYLKKFEINKRLYDKYDLFFSADNIFEQNYEEAYQYSTMGRTFNFGLRRVY